MELSANYFDARNLPRKVGSSCTSCVGFAAQLGSSPEEVNALISDDLGMTMAALKAHPKVYWLWNHRRWCLERVPDGPGGEGSSEYHGWKTARWEEELRVVEKMLDADARNCTWAAEDSEPLWILIWLKSTHGITDGIF